MGYKPIMDQLEAQDEHAQRVAGLAEIGLGFFLVVQSLMSGFTGILTALLFWQLLRMKFHMPRTSAKQKQAWVTFNLYMGPVLEKLPPVKQITDKAVAFYCQNPAQSA